MATPLKVLVISPSYKPAFVYGGPMRSIAALCEQLVQKEIKLSVITTTANGTSELNVKPGIVQFVDGVPVQYYRRWTGDHSHFSPGLLSKVWTQVRRHDVVHIQSWWNLVSVFSALICALRGVRPLISLRGTLSSHSFSHNHVSLKKAFHSFLGRPLLKRSILHVTSVKEEQEVKGIVLSATTVVLPNILEIRSPLPRNGQHKNEMQLLFVGRIHPIKNLELLIDALKEMNSEGEAYSVKIAGEGETAYVNALKARASGLQNIQWIGEVDGTQKYKLMSESDLLVLLSHSENFGNVVFEALSQGTPVLVSKNTGAGEYIRQHELGWVIDPSVEQCRTALKEIAGDTSKREHIRKHAWQTLDAEFNPVRLAQQYERLYRKMAEDVI